MKLHDLTTHTVFHNSVREDSEKSHPPYPGQSSGALKRWISNHYHSKVNCRTASRVKNDPNANNFYKKRASWYQNIHCKGSKQVMKEYDEYLELPDEVTHFIEQLQPHDAGNHHIGEYIIHYEGFPPDSPRHQGYEGLSHTAGDYDHTYEQILDEFVDNEGGAQPLTSGLAGHDSQPIMYAVFKKAVEETQVDQQITEAINQLTFLKNKF